MDQVCTRFCPTLIGALHIGHLVSLYCNFFHAKKHRGRFMVRCMCPGDTQSGEADRFLKLLVPDTRIIYQLSSNDDLLLELTDTRLWEMGVHVSHLYNPAFVGVLYDWMLGVNTLIRGKDWMGGEQHEESLMTNAMLSDLSVRSMSLHFSPLLVQLEGKKISKTDGIREVTLGFLLRRIHPISLLSYVVYLFEGDLCADLRNYHKVFDIERVCETVCYSYDSDTLFAVDRDIKMAYLMKAGVGESDARSRISSGKSMDEISVLLDAEYREIMKMSRMS